MHSSSLSHFHIGLQLLVRATSLTLLFSRGVNLGLHVGQVDALGPLLVVKVAHGAAFRLPVLACLKTKYNCKEVSCKVSDHYLHEVGPIRLLQLAAEFGKSGRYCCG